MYIHIYIYIQIGLTLQNLKSNSSTAHTYLWVGSNSCCFILDLLYLCVGYFGYLVGVRKLITQEAVRPCASVDLSFISHGLTPTMFLTQIHRRILWSSGHC